MEGRLEEALFDDKKIRANKEKSLIAEEAYKLIGKGDSLYLDGGSTTLGLARMLKDRTDLCCWHCTERCESMLPIPKCFDSYEKAFYVFGAVCSPGCAKAYILEHSSFDRGQQLNVLMKMLHEVYGLTELVNETPPRAALKKFGGPFEPRQSAPEGAVVTRRLVQPPFVSYSMVVEERQEAATSNLPRFVPRPPEDADAFDEPPEEALFASYVAARQA